MEHNSAFRTCYSIAAACAMQAVSAAIAKGQSLEVAVSAAVVDAQLELVAFLKADGAFPHSMEAARRKAQTAASTGRPSGYMSPELAIALPLSTGNILTNVRGGLPIQFEDILVGAIGISGCPNPEQDVEIAQAVLEAIAADRVPC